MAAPDDSIHKLILEPLPGPDQASIRWDWGRVGNAVVGRLQVDKSTAITLKLLKTTWSDFKRTITPAADGAVGEAVLKDGRKINWRLQTSPAPASQNGDILLWNADPSKPIYLAAGIGDLPALATTDAILQKAEAAYQYKRPAAEGARGDFVGAIADNMNNSRVFSSDLQLLHHRVGRKWASGVNRAPVFCWDSFFNAALSALDDPDMAKNTIRAALSAHAMNDDPNDGMVPNFSHWKFGSIDESRDRSQPPVGSLCVWKLNQRWPDKAFLTEVYPKLKKWHAWWPKHRDAKHDGLLEWGSDEEKLPENQRNKDHGWQGALYETGWDDTVHFSGKMVGATMNVYAVDLNSLWSMDAEYLGLIADTLGLADDAAMFRKQHEEMNRKINDILWNESLGIYCSRSWGEDGKPGAFLTRMTPANFYPLICGAPDTDRAARVLKVMTDPALFWGRWKLSTVAYNDPAYNQQVYWRGTVWAPVNYLLFQGMKRYAKPEQRNEFARSSVDIFMRNWEFCGACGENYLSTTGGQAKTRFRQELHMGRADGPHRRGKPH